MSTTTSTRAYLAQKYMCGPKADAILAREQTKKKKKRKHADGGQQSHSGGGMGIVDDDGGWGVAVGDDDDDDDVAEAVVASDRTFKKRKVAGGDSGGWISAAPPEKPPTPPPAEDEQPVIVEDESAHGGLLSQAELQKRFGAQKSKLKEDLPTTEQQETVYRDASGRKIDTKAERAEAARRKREQEEMDAKRMQWGKGIVQREETEETRKQMERNRLKGFARHVDDADLNAAQKDAMRWNDPAAAFLSDKDKKKKESRKPVYTGPPPPPNRFGILPGYRWDGVDRSNGFEKKYFQRQNDRSRNTTEAYNWSVDDM